jgi:CRAL/TRIO domain
MFLLIILRRAKYDFDTACKKIDHIFMLKFKHPHHYLIKDKKDIVLKKCLALMDTGFYYASSKKDDLGRSALFCFYGRRNPDLFKMYDVFTLLAILVNAILLNDEELHVNGLITISDFKGFGLKHVWSLSDLKAGKDGIAANTCREKYTFVTNMKSVVVPLIKFWKLFASEKMKKRFHILSKPNEVCNYVKPKSVLPIEFGGDVHSEKEMIEYSKGVLTKHFDTLYEILTTEYDDDEIFKKTGYCS